jgi:dUTP pyrophosphatase
MKVGFKKLDKNAKIPAYALEGDAGIDFYAVSKTVDAQGNIFYGTGIALEIPEGYFAFLMPRSSNLNRDVIMPHSMGLIDSNFRGEIKFVYSPYRSTGRINIGEHVNVPAPYDYEVGERVGQMVILPYPKIELEEKEELSDTNRGSGGYGHTGK